MVSMYEIKYFTYANEDFLKLNSLLDDDYFDKYGEISLKYKPYNSLDDVKDFFVAYEGNSAVACGCIRYFADDTAELKRVFVLKEYRRQGIAEAIVKRCEEKAVELGYQYLTLETGVKLTEAIELYLKKGYSMIENFGQFAGDEICCCMRKQLICNVEK